MLNVSRENAIKGYKVTDKNMQCRGYQFELSKAFSEKGAKLCDIGFHFCVNICKCWGYYEFSNENRVFEVIAYGKIDGDETDKMCSENIELIRELTWDEVLKISNTGDSNTGDSNTGHWNTGHWNTGIFNTINGIKNQVFNKLIAEEEYSRIYYPEFLYFSQVKFIGHDIATEEEQKEHKIDFELNGGFLKDIGYKAAFIQSWNNADKEDRIKIKDIPGFDKDIFFEISGIDVDKDVN
jgi:hypothetical protein